MSLLLLACTAGPEPLDSASSEDEEGLWIATSVLDAEREGPTEIRVYDPVGEVAWTSEVMALEVVMQVRFDPQGEGLWVFSQAYRSAEEADFLLQHVDWSGEELGRLGGFGHTSFVLLADGGVRLLHKTVEDLDGQAILVDQIVEYDAQGQELGPVWTVTDDIEVRSLHTVAQPGDGGAPMDWFHANSLHMDERGHSFLSLGDVSAAVELDAQLDLVQVLDAQGAYVGHSGDAPPLELPHSFEPLGEQRWLAFNRRNPTDASVCSELVELGLSEDGSSVERLAAWSPEDCPKTTILGAARALPEGGRLVSFGSAGRLVVLDEDLQVELQIDLELGQAFGQPDWSTQGPP